MTIQPKGPKPFLTKDREKNIYDWILKSAACDFLLKKYIGFFWPFNKLWMNQILKLLLKPLGTELAECFLKEYIQYFYDIFLSNI